MNICLSVPGRNGGTTITEESIRGRLLEAAKTLFAEKGYAGASVREICTMADASVPMIHHYFGNKEGLHKAILEQFSTDTFAVPIRLLSGEVRSREEFLVRLELLVGETFQALAEQAPVFRIAARDGKNFAEFKEFRAALIAFFSSAQAKGFVRRSMNIEMATGMLLDRLGNQILFAINPHNQGPNVLTSEDYRDEWLKANTEILLFGLAGE